MLLWIENCLCIRKICYEQLIKYQKQSSKSWQCSQTRYNIWLQSLHSMELYGNVHYSTFQFLIHEKI
jgi:hypothetical protein